MMTYGVCNRDQGEIEAKLPSGESMAPLHGHCDDERLDCAKEALYQDCKQLVRVLLEQQPLYVCINECNYIDRYIAI